MALADLIEDINAMTDADDALDAWNNAIAAMVVPTKNPQVDKTNINKMVAELDAVVDQKEDLSDVAWNALCDAYEVNAKNVLDEQKTLFMDPHFVKV